MNHSVIEEKKQIRQAVLKALYEITNEHNASTDVIMDAADIGQQIGMTVEQIEDAAKYLEGEGFVRSRGMGSHESGFSYSLTHEGRVEAEHLLEEDAKVNQPAYDHERMQFLFTQLANSDWQTFGGVTGQIFSELDRVAQDSTHYRRYEADRKSKWKDWPAPNGAFLDSWSMPTNLDDTKSLSYDIFRSCAESTDGGVSLAFTLFREMKHADGISKLRRTFLRYFAKTIEDIANEINPKKEHRRKTSSSIPLEIGHLHPEVQRIAGPTVSDGHYRSAITDTFIGLDNYVKAKSGLTEDGTSLMQRAFSQKNPVLELSMNQEEQIGFMMLFAGAMKAIRNQYAHSLIAPNSKEEALEWLGFASALFRLTDSAKKNPNTGDLNER